MFYKLPYQEVSMESIAIEAGVSKATLYRRWSNKPLLAVEVLISVVLSERLPFEAKSFREHMTLNLKALRNMLASDYSDVIVSVIAETQHDKTLRDIFYRRFLLPVQAIGDDDIDRAVVLGEIKSHRSVSDDEIDIIVDGLLTVLDT